MILSEANPIFEPLCTLGAPIILLSIPSAAK